MLQPGRGSASGPPQRVGQVQLRCDIEQGKPLVVPVVDERDQRVVGEGLRLGLHPRLLGGAVCCHHHPSLPGPAAKAYQSAPQTWAAAPCPPKQVKPILQSER